LTLTGLSSLLLRQQNRRRAQRAELLLKLGHGGNGLPHWELPLRCIDTATLTFLYDTRGENEVGPSAVRLVQEHGAIVRVVDEWLKAPGPDSARSPRAVESTRAMPGSRGARSRAAAHVVESVD